MSAQHSVVPHMDGDSALDDFGDAVNIRGGYKVFVVRSPCSCQAVIEIYMLQT